MVVCLGYSCTFEVPVNDSLYYKDYLLSHVSCIAYLYSMKLIDPYIECSGMLVVSNFSDDPCES